ncbi:MAG: DUF1289 domain-containing protein [Sphingobium sp.]
MDTPMIESPCNRLCTLDRNDVCIGCGRTMDEIIDWANMTDEERRAIMARLALPKP